MSKVTTHDGRRDERLSRLDEWRMKNMSRCCSPASHAFVFLIAYGIHGTRDKNTRMRHSRRRHFLLTHTRETNEQTLQHHRKSSPSQTLFSIMHALENAASIVEHICWQTFNVEINRVRCRMRDVQRHVILYKSFSASDTKSISTSFLRLYRAIAPQPRSTKLSSLLTLGRGAIKGSRRWNSRGRPEISSPENQWRCFRRKIMANPPSSTMEVDRESALESLENFGRDVTRCCL